MVSPVWARISFGYHPMSGYSHDGHRHRPHTAAVGARDGRAGSAHRRERVHRVCGGAAGDAVFPLLPRCLLRGLLCQVETGVLNSVRVCVSRSLHVTISLVCVYGEGLDNVQAIARLFGSHRPSFVPPFVRAADTTPLPPAVR